MSAERHLAAAPEASQRIWRLIDPETGAYEDHPSCPTCQVHEDEISGLHRDLRAEHARFESLRRDKAAEAKKNPLWPKAMELFAYWREQCKHPRARFTVDRFELIAPFIDSHGLDACKLAVDGAAYEPFETKRRNGSVKRHDGLALIFRSAEKLEEFACRAPRDRIAAYKQRREEENGQP